MEPNVSRSCLGKYRKREDRVANREDRRLKGDNSAIEYLLEMKRETERKTIRDDESAETMSVLSI